MAKMKISDLIFAKNAPAAFHRPLIVISVIICIVWSVYFQDEVGGFMWLDPAAWLTYLIGLAVAALVVPTALGVYFFLPPLGKNRKWEKLLLIAGFVIAIGLTALGLIVDGARSFVRHIDAWLMGIFVFTFVPTVAFKILVWLWQGVRRQEK